jgi:sugar lactone lactonase YvrE
MSLPALFAVAAARPAPSKPAPATPADSPATPADASAAPDGSVQDSVTLGKAPVPGQWTVCPAPGKFITCLLATQDALWVGTEDASLWRLDLKSDPTQVSSWKQFPTSLTKTDNIYGLAQDAEGRLWVGTQNQGVSVYNGKEWKNYGVIDGPIGEHVFCIAADPDPKRGTVWIATDHGLTSWTPDPPPDAATSAPATKDAAAKAASPAVAPEKMDAASLAAKAAAIDPFAARGIADPNLAMGTWRSYTKADGLPSSQIYAVTVAPGGRVWVGTECDGLACSDPPYKTWQVLRAASERSGDTPGANGRAAVGWLPGLPSNLTNSILALPDGSVAYGTNYGLALSRDGGRSWRSWQGVSNMAYENYLRGMACDKAGGLWIATRHKGLVRLDLATGAHKTFAKPQLPDDYVFDVAVSADGSVWAGTYGGGLARTTMPALAAAPPMANTSAGAAPDRSAALAMYGAAVAGRPAPSTTPSTFAGADRPASAADRQPATPLLPAPAAPPTLDELNAMLAFLSKVPFVEPDKQPVVVRLDDDWLTKGDCLGRYGRYWGCWCAICSPEDFTWGPGPVPVDYCGRIGPNHDKDDTLRYWVHWLYTKNPNSLEMPSVYYDSRVTKKLTTLDFTRRQAEWDDHGETYPMSKDGPGVYCILKIPAGLYYISLYDFNKDGHDGANRYRDFTLSLRLHDSTRPIYDVAGFKASPELARGRIRDFWGGNYKRFLVRGPTEIAVEINRNHSFCTIMAGVFLDLVDEEPVPYFHDLEEWKGISKKQAADCDALRIMPVADRSARFQGSSTPLEATAKLFQELQRTRLTHSVWWASDSRCFYAAVLRWTLAVYKALPAGPEKQDLAARAATCYYQLGYYAKWEEGQVALGKMTARQVEKAIHWNGRSFTYRRMGFITITQYLASLMKSKLPDTKEPEEED